MTFTHPQRAETAAVLVHGHQPIDVLIRLLWPRFAGGTRLDGTGGGICLTLSNHRRSCQLLGGGLGLLCKERENPSISNRVFQQLRLMVHVAADAADDDDE